MVIQAPQIWEYKLQHPRGLSPRNPEEGIEYYNAMQGLDEVGFVPVQSMGKDSLEVSHIRRYSVSYTGARKMLIILPQKDEGIKVSS
jgi:hypothetical protein